MPEFAAVIGKSKTNRIMSVGAATEEQARAEIVRQLEKNPQRRTILRHWQADGAKIVEEPRTPAPAFDEAQANALIRGRLRELLAELSEWNNVTVPPAVYAAFDRARDALKAFDQGVVA